MKSLIASSSVISPNKLFITEKNSAKSKSSEDSSSPSSDSASYSSLGACINSTVGLISRISCCCFLRRTIISRSNSEPNRLENLSRRVPTSPVAILSICPYILSLLPTDRFGSEALLFSQWDWKSEEEVLSDTPPSKFSTSIGCSKSSSKSTSSTGGGGGGGSGNEIPGGRGGRGISCALS